MKNPVSRLVVVLLAAACVLATPLVLRGADALVDGAVDALAQLTDPRRLEPLAEPTFRAQLGPALGWLHVARRRDVAPESVIGRAFARNGLEGERARLTREALLRNLARADAWELFAHERSALALSEGRAAPIPVGLHRGHFAQAAVILPTGLGPENRREFACLVLRADDEPTPAAPPSPRRRRRSVTPGPGEMLAATRRPGTVPVLAAPARRTTNPAANAAPGHVAATAVATAAVTTPATAIPTVATMPITYDDALPVAYTRVGSPEGGTVKVRVEARPGELVDLASYGGPAMGFLLRAVDAGALRFSLLEGGTLSADAPVQTVALDGAGARTGPAYERPGIVRISLCGPARPGDGARTFLFEFPARERPSAF